MLDEPLSALDLNYQFHVRIQSVGIPVRKIGNDIVAHDINIALRHGDHVLMLKRRQAGRQRRAGDGDYCGSVWLKCTGQ
ncbi:hypothetical protein KCP69_20710 [Salmonella enterica subsp. enterica]|nr:hypothetical protein KCP69_20710 [Salmonella enterica subsp. enterica]